MNNSLEVISKHETRQLWRLTGDVTIVQIELLELARLEVY